MAISTDTNRSGDLANRKMPAANVGVASTGAALLAATILWVLGCLKGHQFFMPDDALVLGWSAQLVPTLYVLKLRWDAKLGISNDS